MALHKHPGIWEDMYMEKWDIFYPFYPFPIGSQEPYKRLNILKFWRKNPQDAIYKAPCHMCAKDEVESKFEIDFDILGFRCHACGRTIYFGSFMNNPLIRIECLFHDRSWIIDFSAFIEQREKEQRDAQTSPKTLP